MSAKVSLLNAILLALVLAPSTFATVLYVDANNPNPLPPYGDWTTAATVIQDAVDLAQAGDEVVVTNGVYAAGGRAVHGSMTNRVAVDRALVLRSVNGPKVTVIHGYQVPGSTNGDGAIRCAYLTNGAVLSGFTLTNGATRTSTDDERVHSGGGALCESVNSLITNCVITGNSAIDGGGTVFGTLNNCTLRGNAAQRVGGGAYTGTLTGCLLSSNSISHPGGDAFGGGVCYATLTDCSLLGNSVVGSRVYGGGAYLCKLNDCVLMDNSSSLSGGGSAYCSLFNCTVVGNSASQLGGGTVGSGVYDSILYFNTADTGPNHDEDSTMSYCCTVPFATNGLGNITNEPLFINRLNGNLRLQSNSPCINAGANSYATGPTDLDGNPRLVGGTVDFGAYEFQTPSSLLSYSWLQQYGFPTDGSADLTDPDNDGLNNWQEWQAGTSPTNGASVLRLLTPVPVGTSYSVTWQSVEGRTYFIDRSTNPSSPLFTTLATNIAGHAGTTTFIDTNAPPGAPRLYRVGVSTQ